MRHKPIPKKKREQVYTKYDGHCAYCGCKLEYKDMQVDHAESLWNKAFPDGQKKVCDDPKMTQDDSIKNLMPSCRACNFYKGACNIEEFRTILKNSLEATSIKTFQNRLAEKHGMLEFRPWDGKFFFEKAISQTHELKLSTQYFEDIANSRKNFEVRFNDRDYKEGDRLLLKEWNGEDYTGRYIERTIRYILSDQQYCKEGYVILGF